MTTSTFEQQESRRLFWIASLMFFLSGGTGLAYQVIWFKRFAHVWGSSSLAFASVGGSFLFGLGVGAYLIGRYADRVLRPLRWYGFCELAIGVGAILIPLEIQFLVEQSASFYSSLPSDPLPRFMLQFFVTLLVVGPPCVLMGGTLPLLIRELTSRDGRLDQATGWLYAINTFGAAAGCFLTGFWLLPSQGLATANYLAAAVNLSIGAVAVWMTGAQTGARRKSPEAQAAKAIAAANAAAEPAPWTLPLFGLYVAVTLSGLGALILEMTWSRQLALLLGGSTYTYSATLFVVLVGIASGSLAFHLVLRRYALNPWLPVIVIGALALTCLACKLLMPELAIALKADVRSGSPTGVGILRKTLAGNAFVCVLASIALELIPSIAMGILFPLFVDLTRASAARVGRAVGDVYAWNTFGSIAGASLTSVLLFPWIGTYGSIALATGLYVVALLLVLPVGRLSQWLLSAGCLAVGAGIIYGILTPQDPVYTNIGKYMYGDALQAEEFNTIYFAEGASSNVMVARGKTGSTNLRVNGKVDASDATDMLTQAGLAYVPRLFKPDAKDVFVIGFGSGTTSGVSLLFPGTRVTCCEIEPAVYRAAEHFGHVNHRPYEHTREFLEKKNADLPTAQRLTDEQIDEQATFKVIFGDGRTTLQGSDQKYDLIISEPSNPWLAGVSNLFTREFFRAARTHLKEGGILSQWVQTYNLTKDEYELIVRTLRSEFPHCVICVGGPSDTLLMASEQPIKADPAAIGRLQKLVDDTPAIKKDLQQVFHNTDLSLLLLQHFTADERSLDAKAGVGTNKPLNTDLNLLLEFLAPLHLYDPVAPDQSATEIVAKPDQAAHEALAKLFGVPLDSARYKRALGQRSWGALKYVDALQYFREALTSNPQDTETLAVLDQTLRDLRAPAVASETFQKLCEALPDNEAFLLRHVESLGAEKKGDDQLKTLEKFIERNPKSLVAREALARILALQQRHDESLKIYQELNELRPNHALTLAETAQEYSALKKTAESVDYYQRALATMPKFDNQSPAWLWANNLAWIRATSVNPEFRNGAEAVKLAKQACDAVDFKQPQQLVLIDTLACAYAESGDFAKAIEHEKRFTQGMREAQFNPEAIQAAEARIKLFESGRPYREE